MTISFQHKPNSIFEVPFEFGEAFYRERNLHEAAIKELNDRLIERQQSFQAQLIRIEDTWREKLKQARLKTPYQVKLEEVTKEIEQIEKELLHKR